MRLYARGRISGRGTVCRPAGPDGGARGGRWNRRKDTGRSRIGNGNGNGLSAGGSDRCGRRRGAGARRRCGGDDILSALARVEYAERAGVLEEGSGGFSGRLGIRFELKDGTLWFYRETIDTH